MKFDRLGTYPAGSTDRVQSTLLTAWPSIPESLRSELVLVGGLAIHLHTRRKPNPLGPMSVTLDIDLGIALGATSGVYETLSQSLLAVGFLPSEARLVREVRGQQIAIDFLVEGPVGRHPKDAFDLMTLAMVHPTLAAKAFEEEAVAHNPGYAIARGCLESFFLEADADGPRRALAFRDGDESLHSLSDESRRTLEQMATMGHFLLG